MCNRNLRRCYWCPRRPITTPPLHVCFMFPDHFINNFDNLFNDIWTILQCASTFQCLQFENFGFKVSNLGRSMKCYCTTHFWKCTKMFEDFVVYVTPLVILHIMWNSILVFASELFLVCNVWAETKLVVVGKTYARNMLSCKSIARIRPFLQIPFWSWVCTTFSPSCFLMSACRRPFLLLLLSLLQLNRYLILINQLSDLWWHADKTLFLYKIY